MTPPSSRVAAGASAAPAFLILAGTLAYSTGLPTLERLYGWDPGLRLVALGLAAALGAHVVLDARARGRRPVPVGLLIAVVPAVGAAASFLKDDASAIMPPLVTGLLVVCCAYLDRAAAARGLLAFLTLTIVSSLVLGVLDSRTVLPGRDFLPIVLDGRAAGLCGHPNMLAVLCGLSCLVGYRSLRSMRSAWVALVVGVLGLLATASQTSLIATGVATILVVGTALLRERGPLLALLAVLLGAGSLWWATAQAAPERTVVTSGADLTLSDLTFSGRTEIWRSVLSADVGRLGLTDDAFEAVVRATANVGSAHNTWLEAWGRSGVPGLVAVGVAFVGLAVAAMRRGAHRDQRVAFVAFLAVLSAMEGVLFALPLVVVFGVFLAGQARAEVKAESPLSVSEPSGASRALRPTAAHPGGRRTPGRR